VLTRRQGKTDKCNCSGKQQNARARAPIDFRSQQRLQSLGSPLTGDREPFSLVGPARPTTITAIH
jgi:hypothetical protein